jgi:translation initiation factor IF-2
MPKAIFELAKELGKGPLDLVEELKKRGFSVRNHMSVLSDEDLTSFLAMIAETKKVGEVSKPKVVKKKVVNKEQADDKKKKTESKTGTVAKTEKRKHGDEAPKEVVAPAGKVLRRKKASEVKSQDEDETDVLPLTPESTLEEQTEELAEETSDDGQLFTDDLEKVRRRTLQVVKGAEQKEIASQKPSTVEPKVEGGSLAQPKQEPGLFEEKMHRFTQIAPAPKKPTTAVEGEEQAKSAEKKRLGGLASMMSKQKGPSIRTKEIAELRVEEEIKVFGLGKIGRTIYANVGKKKVYLGATQQTMITDVKESKRVINVHEGCTVGELAGHLSKKMSEVANACLDMNLLVSEDDYVGLALASKIAALFNYRVDNVAFKEEEIIQKKSIAENLVTRPPVVTIMGHVDHGKTTLLDYIRKAKVAAGEAGGITQHIGAYQVQVKDSLITFLDTPGHAAFAAMRQRGADVTDIVVLVVAADDGIMPQTKESIRFIQQANKPLIVAINKMDKPGVNPDRIKQSLAEFNINPEEWGGDVQCVEISALTGKGVDNLLENIVLLSEVLELKADPKGPAEGVVIESRVETGRGPVATILISSGTLKKGDAIVAGETFGRARSILNVRGEDIKEAPPATPVQVLGLEQTPNPGDKIDGVKNEREAKKIVENRIQLKKELQVVSAPKMASLEDFFADVKEKHEKVLNLIIRTDVQGSYEAIKNSLEAQGNNEVSLKVIGGGVGPITDSDVDMAATSGGYIIGFNMRPVTSARKLAEMKGIDIKNYSIIYELIDDIKLALEGLLAPETVEVFIGRAEVKNTFSIPKVGTIAGCFVIDGKIERGCNVRLLRGGKIIHDGKLSSLKRFKDDVKEVKNGLECGMGLEDYNDIKVEDIFEAYISQERKRFLDAPSKTL